MVFNERSGSLYETVLEKIKSKGADIPDEVIAQYEDYEEYAREKPKSAARYRLSDLSRLARDEPEVGAWRDHLRAETYSANKDAISQWAAFMAIIADSESTMNIGNVIVSMNDPTQIRYFIDAHPNLQEGSHDMRWGADSSYHSIFNNNQYFPKNDVAAGAIDLDAVAKEIEAFKEKLSDKAIDETIFRASMLTGRLLSNKPGFRTDAQYFTQLRDFYKLRRDTLKCEF